MTEIDYSTIKTLKKQVYWVLENRPETRNSDALLTETICAHFVDRFGLKYVPLKISETVGRCRRKIQSDDKFLPTNPKVAKARKRNIDEYRVAMGYPSRDGSYTPPSLRDERTGELFNQ